jgi:hypothetical protein
MLINVSTRKLRRTVRLPEGDLQYFEIASFARFVALSCETVSGQFGGLSQICVTCVVANVARRLNAAQTQAWD